MRILFRCWKDRTIYDETQYTESLGRRSAAPSTDVQIKRKRLPASRNQQPFQLDSKTQMSPMVFGIIPEHRSASLRIERSALAESTFTSPTISESKKTRGP
jgi:hypothetical protein